MKISRFLVAAVATAAVVASTAASAAWQPRKPVEFIIMAGTGGGADQIARLLQGLIEKKNLSPRPFIPINKPGGSGAEALRYLKDKAGDDHVVPALQKLPGQPQADAAGAARDDDDLPAAVHEHSPAIVVAFFIRNKP